MNEQLKAWRGDLGDAYTDRHPITEDQIKARREMWRRILEPLEQEHVPLFSILEVGANVGLNLRALRELRCSRLMAVEPNAQARGMLADENIAHEVYDGTADSIPLKDGAADLVFTCGLLIHIHPGDLLAACTEIHRVAGKFVCCIEYFSPEPEAIEYRGQEGLLFKRDFGGFYLDNFPDLSLVDCTFFWKRTTGLDNLTAWVFKKG